MNAKASGGYANRSIFGQGTWKLRGSNIEVRIDEFFPSELRPRFDLGRGIITTLTDSKLVVRPAGLDQGESMRFTRM